MSIKDFAEKIKLFTSVWKERLLRLKESLKIKEDLFVALLIVLVGLASFGLGKLSVIEAEKTPISIANDGQTAGNMPGSANTSGTSTGQAVTGQGIVFGSKTGTKYYYPSCSGAGRIKPENRVWFPTIAAAKAAGLTPAANCPGLN